MGINVPTGLLGPGSSCSPMLRKAKLLSTCQSIWSRPCPVQLEETAIRQAQALQDAQAAEASAADASSRFQQAQQDCQVGRTGKVTA